MATPLYVTNALIEVFSAGSVNVFDREAVTALVGSKRAGEWLDKASDSQYKDAVIDAGAAESDDFMPVETKQDDDDEFWLNDKGLTRY